MRTRAPAFLAALLLLIAVASAGCARRRAPETPPAPPAVQGPAPAPKGTSPPASKPGPRSVPSVTGTTKRRTPLATLRARAVADTAAAHASLARCGARKLLPEDEATVDAVRDLMRRARAAFAEKNVDLAASYARGARQLASSLGCR